MFKRDPVFPSFCVLAGCRTEVGRFYNGTLSLKFLKNQFLSQLCGAGGFPLPMACEDKTLRWSLVGVGCYRYRYLWTLFSEIWRETSVSLNRVRQNTTLISQGGDRHSNLPLFTPARGLGGCGETNHRSCMW